MFSMLSALIATDGCDSAPTGRSGLYVPVTTGGSAASGGKTGLGGAASGGKTGLGGAANSGGSSVGGFTSQSTGNDAGTYQRLQDYLGDSTYPDDFWQTATASESNMDPGILEQAVDWIQSKGWEVHSFIIARNGRLAFERYGWKSGSNPGDPDTTPHQMVPSERHPVFSVTKSFVSALVGQAISDGFISGVDHPVAEWFTDYSQLNPSAQKSTITLEDLLTMRSGLAFSEGETEVFDDELSPARALLSRELATTPGSTWNYSSGDAEITAEILRITTGMTPLQYAQSRLFGPMGIVGAAWDAGQSGTNHGGFGLSLSAREMARFGELYRNHGLWAGQQLVPTTWVTTSTSYKCPTLWGMDYGYYWFLPTLNDFFVAIGFNGQQIFVSRNFGLVIVFTGDVPSAEANNDYSEIISKFVIPALK
jgi:CubicO group peptidase (beta-lactamase class C family)